MNNLTKNTVGLRISKVFPPDNGKNNSQMVATIQAELMNLGYMLDGEAFNAMTKADESWLINFHNEVINYIKTGIGANIVAQPFYRNFPKEVMEKSDVEIFFNAIFHYWSNGEWEPNTPALSRPVAFEKVTYTMLSFGNNNDFKNIFASLVSMNQSLTPQDKEIVKWFVDYGVYAMPEKIPFKETLIYLATLKLPVPVKTATDVLRIAVGLSGGDFSLPAVPAKKVKLNKWSRTLSDNPEREKFKFKSFSRAERRYLMGLLEKVGANAVYEMKLKRERWIRLGERLHPGEFKNTYPVACASFGQLRNTKVKSWYSLLNEKYKTASFAEAVEFHSKRPGEFFRNLDFLFRNNQDSKNNLNILFNAMELCGSNVSNKVLFETLEHFNKRIDPVTNRKITIKGKRVKTQLPDLPAINKSVVDQIQKTIMQILSNKFAQLPKMGMVWVDEKLRDIPLPKNMRSLSPSLRPKVRGTGNDIDPQAKVLRAFVKWVDKNGSEDLDLSATFVGESVGVLSFSTTGLKLGSSCHSGDIRHRRGNCTEYVDVDFADAISRGFKYVMVDVRNFNGRSLESVNSVFGFETREFPMAGEIYNPKNVKDAFTLTSKSTNTLCTIIDLENRKYIMVDEDSDGFVTARSDIKNVIEAIKDYTETPKFSVYDLIIMHMNSRGGKMATKEHADTPFNFEDYEYSYEKTMELMGV